MRRAWLLPLLLAALAGPLPARGDLSPPLRVAYLAANAGEIDPCG